MRLVLWDTWNVHLVQWASWNIHKHLPELISVIWTCRCISYDRIPGSYTQTFRACSAWCKHSIVDVAENVLPSVDRGVERSLRQNACAFCPFAVNSSTSKVYLVSCVGCLPACCRTLCLNLGLFGGGLELHFVSV